ncbi:hypothetical protein ABAZ39_12005 [Azospirillum argentinense]|uniref:Uncharacterized protein n=1 Tax=Azospirillum argentinense TaxID=2970906 RepID=A0A060DNJ9_9PROT|nr:hypothetical protein [Azospirillum argentinense]AIB12698.1 hypothetical protein ABAZ39_12005 [Azospirillum argentinense]EZQ09475.1 transporter [Azospirillum argentinense]
MGGITTLATTALPLANAVADTVDRVSGTSDSARRQQAADERRYAYQTEQQRLQWQREDELRRQDQELQRQKEEQARAEAERQRAREMDWLAQSQNLAAQQLRTGQAATLADKEGDARTRLAQMSAAAQSDERRRVDALRRTVARTRATLGSNGVSAADGSGEAILLGVVKDSAAERGEAEGADRLKREAIQQEVDSVRRRNLLEQAQLAERQRLEFMSRFY